MKGNSSPLFSFIVLRSYVLEKIRKCSVEKIIVLIVFRRAMSQWEEKRWQHKLLKRELFLGEKTF